jgi:branched-chain amino acid transport system substrate-binding protein
MEKQIKKVGIKKRLIQVGRMFVIVLAAVTFLFCAPDVKAQGVIKIGLIVPLTGPHGREAVDMKNGTLMAIDEINAKGGVLGKKVELVVRDDQMNSAEGARKAKELVEQEGVKYTLGTISSAVQMAVNNYTKRVGVLFLSLSCSDEINRVPDFSKYTFHEFGTNYMFNQAAGNYAFDHNFGKKFYVLYYDYVFGYDGLKNISKVVESRGGTIVGSAAHPLRTADYTPFFPKILAAKPDVLYIWNWGKDQVNCLKQAYSYGLHKKMKIMAAITSITMAKEAGAEVFEGVHSSVVFYWGLMNKYPTAKKFVTNYMNRVGYPPINQAATAYSGTMEILQAMRRANTDDVNKVIMAMEGHTYAHVKGEQTWRKCDHQSIQDIYIIKGKKPSEMKGEWDLYDVVGQWRGERSCKELGHE